MPDDSLSPISNEKKKHYRQIGHKLKPVVTIAGNGLSDNVVNELNRALDDHELVKIKLAIDDREMRKQIITTACKQLKAQLIQEVGKVALILRPAKKAKIKTTNLTKM